MGGHPNITILPADGYIMAFYNRNETILYKGELVKMPNDDSDFRAQYFRPEMKGDPYPGSQNVTALAAYNNYTKLDGDKDMVELYPITNIQKNEDGSISFRFMDTITGIESVADTKALNDSRVYSIDGRYLGSNPGTSRFFIRAQDKVLLIP